nr:type 2 lanthipeptide synthetase LanM [uncultured Anaerococcus sp.]
MLTETTIRIVNYICELIHNIDKDVFLLTRNETLYRKSELSDIDFNLGDSHSLNKTVVIFTLDNQKIVYKPKRMESFNAFSDIIKYINTKYPKNDLIIPKVITRDYYAYVEYINYRECQNKCLSNFYKRFGYQLALMYVFNCTDIHMENLIAREEYPVIIDLETILQIPNYFQEDGYSFFNEIIESHFNTVNRTSMLISELDTGNNQSVDIGALFGDEAIINDILTLIDYGYDTIRLESKKVKMKRSRNIPKNERSYDLNLYMNDIILGFQEYYRILLRELKNNDFKNLIYKLSNLDTRVIYRNTSVYDNILKNAYHPDFMRDMLDREKIFENLWENTMLSPDIIFAEIKTLKNEDIPLFINNPSNSIIKETDTIIGSVDLVTGKEYFFKRLNFYNEKDLKLQTSLLKLDFENKYLEKCNYGNNSDNKKIRDVISNDSLLFDNQFNVEYIKSEIKEFVEYVIDNIKFIEGKFYIMSVKYNDNAESSFNIMDNSFYDGVCGLVFFLRNYAIEINDLKIIELTNRMIRQIIEELPDYDLNKTDDLGMNGMCSIIHLLSNCDLNSFQYEDIDKCIKIICNKLKDINIDNFLKDYLNGIPSILIALCKLFKKTHDPEILYTINIVTDVLFSYLKHAKNLELKKLGYAHSVRSVLFSLIKSYEILERDELIKFINDNIFDLTEDITKSHSLKWCNGLVGTFMVNKGLIDSKLLDSRSSKIIENENLLIRRKIMNSYLMSQDCICHGNSGIVEFFILNGEFENALRMAKYIFVEKEKNRKYKIREIDVIRNLSLYTGVLGIYFEMMNAFLSKKNLLLGADLYENINN